MKANKLSLEELTYLNRVKSGVTSLQFSDGFTKSLSHGKFSFRSSH